MEKKNQPSDNILVEEFIELLVTHQNRIYAYILGLLANYNDADDVMQETCRVMWRKFTEFKKGTDFVAWGVKIAFYCVLNFRKSKRLRSKVVFSSEALKWLQEDARAGLRQLDERLRALEHCITKLKERDHELVKMRYDRGIAVKKIAEHLGKTVQSVYQSMTRIQGMLLRCIRLTLSTEGI